jgi:hypothetical protein
MAELVAVAGSAIEHAVGEQQRSFSGPEAAAVALELAVGVAEPEAVVRGAARSLSWPRSVISNGVCTPHVIQVKVLEGPCQRAIVAFDERAIDADLADRLADGENDGVHANRAGVPVSDHG